MAKAVIKTKTGTSIVIEGTQEEVAKIVTDFDNRETIIRTKTEATKELVRKKEDKKRRGASNLIIELREEGFFDEAKTLGEIAAALEDKGYLYPVTTLSGVILGLVQKKLIGRKKTDGKWVYGK